MSFFTFTSLEVDLFKTQSMIFGHNERNLNQEAFYLNKDQIEITMNINILGLISIHMVVWTIE
jgi:hypothetical protein